MAFQTPLTVKELVDGIYGHKYYLPSIQREFVWSTDKIEKLFDSLMKGFPIGSFLFWEIPADKKDTFVFYEFIRNYHQRDNKHNPVANLNGYDKSFQGILDGQQRMTALYIGLRGSYAEKIKYRDVYPVKKLYVNLLDKPDDNDELGLSYDFRFLSDEDAKVRDEKNFWFLVGDILKSDFNDMFGIYTYISENKLNESASKILSTLYQHIKVERTINYYLEKNGDLDKVVNIFIRVNSGGTVLNPSDLLLSFATAQLHGKRNVREEIYNFVDLINDIGGHDNFAFSKDFVLKAFFVMCDEIDSIQFKPSNFNKGNMQILDSHWTDLTEAIQLAVELIDSSGFNKTNFAANNALIPIAHYIYNNRKNYFQDRDKMIHWFIASTLSGTFSSSTDTVLKKIREIIKSNHEGFPIQEMLKKDNYSVDGIIDDIIGMQYKDKSVLMALSILYPQVDLKKNIVHIDHIFPKSKFNQTTFKEESISDTKFYLDNLNSLVNLQLMDGSQNLWKKDKFFDKWLGEAYPDSTERKEYMKTNGIPDINLSFDNFKEFIEKREELLRQKLRKNLQAWIS